MNPSLLLIPDRYKAAKLYSQIPDSGAGDLTFARNSNATRVNSAGLIEKVRENLALYSEQFNDAYWSKGQATITANATTAPNGTLTAEKFIEGSGSVTPEVSRTPIATSNSIFTLSVFAKASERNFLIINNNTGVASRRAWFNLSTGVVGTTAAGTTAFIENVGNGWFRCSLTTDIANFGSATSAFQIGSADGVQTYTGDGTSGIFIWGAQMETGDIATPYIPTTTAAVSVGITADIPRLDYTGGGCPSLLLEPQRTNLALFSEQFDNAAWVKGNATISANTSATLDPSGYNGSDKLQEDSSTGAHDFGSDTVSASSGDVVTYSIFLKAAERSFAAIRLYTGSSSVFGYYNLANGTLGTIGAGGTGTIVSYGNGWYRCSLTITMASSSITLPYVFTSTGDGVNSYTGVTGNGIYCFGAQQEIGSYPTSYIPTLGSSVTRLAETASKTGISSLIGQTEGTLFYDGFFGNEATEVYLFLQKGASSGVDDSIYLQKDTNAIALNVFDGAIQQSFIGGGSFTIGQRVKIAAAYKANDFVLYVNGVQIGTDNSGSVPTCDALQLASYRGAPTTADFIAAKGTDTAALYTTRLTNAELATLTAL